MSYTFRESNDNVPNLLVNAVVLVPSPQSRSFLLSLLFPPLLCDTACHLCSWFELGVGWLIILSFVQFFFFIEGLCLCVFVFMFILLVFFVICFSFLDCCVFMLIILNILRKVMNNMYIISTLLNYD